MARSPRPVRRLLKDKPTLKLLELEISAQKVLLNQVRQLLPGKIARHVVAAQKREQDLVLHTDSPVWATRLRYNGPQIISLLKSSDPSLRNVKVRVLVSRTPTRRRLASARHSDIAAAIIHDSALDTKHRQLRAALLRLSEMLITQKSQ